MKNTISNNEVMGEATSQLLELVMNQRDSGIFPDSNIIDSRYQDLMDNPISTIQKIYHHFNLTLTETTKVAMQDYLKSKPRGKHGKHDYKIEESRNKERSLFKRYQQRYQVPDEI